MWQFYMHLPRGSNAWMSKVLVVRRMWKWTKSSCSLPSTGANTFCTVSPALINSVGGQTMHAETSTYARVNNIASVSITLTSEPLKEKSTTNNNKNNTFFVTLQISCLEYCTISEQGGWYFVPMLVYRVLRKPPQSPGCKPPEISPLGAMMKRRLTQTLFYKFLCWVNQDRNATLQQ